MNVEEFKTRWVRHYIQPEYFYLPVKKTTQRYKEFYITISPRAVHKNFFKSPIDADFELQIGDSFLQDWILLDKNKQKVFQSFDYVKKVDSEDNIYTKITYNSTSPSLYASNASTPTIANKFLPAGEYYLIPLNMNNAPIIASHVEQFIDIDTIINMGYYTKITIPKYSDSLYLYLYPEISYYDICGYWLYRPKTTSLDLKPFEFWCNSNSPPRGKNPILTETADERYSGYLTVKNYRYAINIWILDVNNLSKKIELVSMTNPGPYRVYEEPYSAEGYVNMTGFMNGMGSEVVSQYRSLYLGTLYNVKDSYISQSKPDITFNGYVFASGLSGIVYCCTQRYILEGLPNDNNNHDYTTYNHYSEGCEIPSTADILSLLKGEYDNLFNLPASIDEYVTDAQPKFIKMISNNIGSNFINGDKVHFTVQPTGNIKTTYKGQPTSGYKLNTEDGAIFVTPSQIRIDSDKPYEENPEQLLYKRNGSYECAGLFLDVSSITDYPLYAKIDNEARKNPIQTIDFNQSLLDTVNPYYYVIKSN